MADDKTRATRKKAKKIYKRGAGLSFFIVTVFILAFAVAYTIFEDSWFSTSHIRLNNNEIMVSFIDVGQGDAILIHSNNNAILIDAGDHRSRQVVMDYLNSVNIRHLDYVIATHPHSDHIGALSTVLGRIGAGYVVLPEVVNETTAFENFLAAIENNDISTIFPKPGDELIAGIIRLTILAPPSGPHTEINNSSIVAKLVYGDVSFMFTGDVEASGEEQLLASGVRLNANVLKVAHHGSRTSTIQSFLDATAPDIAVIMVGENNRFNHPSQIILDRLADAGILILRTDELGTIRMVTDGVKIYTP